MRNDQLELPLKGVLGEKAAQAYYSYRHWLFHQNSATIHKEETAQARYREKLFSFILAKSDLFPDAVFLIGLSGNAPEDPCHPTSESQLAEARPFPSFVSLQR
ncbi:unnamed protein product [Haemonchus placei]|uniref:Peptidase_M13 domain-containing protein n=1 Tax=Haemonchus placei TaxID=6290 RepID=A0A0N4WLR8_HAEPC|nr:unnamed protein product [Haemonchus placei]